MNPTTCLAGAFARLSLALSAALLVVPMSVSAGADDLGGTTFDFAAASARRFASSFDASRNIATAPFAGVATNSFSKVVALPSTNGGTWRVSLRYRMRHSVPGTARFRVSPGPVRAFEILECGAEWGELSMLADVPAGKGSLTAAFIFGRGSVVNFEYRDFSVVDETPISPIALKEMPMGNIDGTFAVAEGMCGQLEYYWRHTGDVRYGWKGMTFEVTLPPGIAYVDANFADKASVKTEVKPDGSSVTSFAARQGLWTPAVFYGGSPLGLVVKATGPVGTCGKGRLCLRHCKGDSCFESVADDITFLIVKPFEGQKPKRYCNGVMTGRYFDELTDKAVEDLSRMVASAGVTWLVARGTQERYDMWHKLGIRYVTPSAWCFNNGFQIGYGKIPESDRYVAVGVDPNDRHANIFKGASCPVAVYSGSDFFRTNTTPFITKFLKGSDGCWSNWEPYMFNRKGCMCQRCCRAFADYLGKPYDEIAAKWPACVMKGGEYFETVLKFRSREHAKVVKTLDRVVREATGGESSLGFIPAIAWIEMASWWRPRNYAAEVQAIDYAGALRWMNPWGPYVAWESNHPYVYTKRKPLCHFFAAQDVRKTVNSDYPAGARPKLMALPQGYQCGHWLSQPEHIAMALDSYFFNGWESTVEYYFPRGYDARYWNAFARATDRAARYESFVLDGKRSDAAVEVAPFAGVYASPVRMLSGYLPDYRNISPLQSVSYDLGGSRMVAIFNFWQKGEAFLTLKAKGLKPGRYEVCAEDGTMRVPSAGRRFYTAEELSGSGVRVSVGAVRTKVFVIRPSDGTTSATLETDADFDARFNARRPELERKAAEDAEYERLNGDVAYDPMPVI